MLLHTIGILIASRRQIWSKFLWLGSRGWWGTHKAKRRSSRMMLHQVRLRRSTKTWYLTLYRCVISRYETRNSRFQRVNHQLLRTGRSFSSNSSPNSSTRLARSTCSSWRAFAWTSKGGILPLMLCRVSRNQSRSCIILLGTHLHACRDRLGWSSLRIVDARMINLIP